MNMNRLHTTLAGLAAGCLLTVSAPAADKVSLDGAEVGHWTMDYEAAAKLATEKELPMMLNFTGSDWCGWCKLMDEGVFAKEEWKEFAKENVVLVTLDFPRDKTIVPEKYVARNQELKEQFEVGGYPTYIVVDGDGKTKIGQLGAGRDKTPASFIAEFKAAVRMSPKNIEAYAKANPDKADAYHKAIQEVKDAEQALKDWLATRPQRNEENTQKLADLKQRIEKAKTALGEFQ
jgi:thioredoxin-related protein